MTDTADTDERLDAMLDVLLDESSVVRLQISYGVAWDPDANTMRGCNTVTLYRREESHARRSRWVQVGIPIVNDPGETRSDLLRKIAGLMEQDRGTLRPA